jgi:hypothetical protein
VSNMLPPDIMAAMGGGGGEGAGLPPDIASLLGGGGAPPGAEGPPLPSDGVPGGGQDPLEQAIALLDEAIAAEADQEDQQIMRTCSAKLQQVLAKNQADQDAGLGGQVSPRAMRKQAGAL